MNTMLEAGTPLAEIYRGNGRLTGRVVGEDVPTNAYDRETNYTWVGGVTEDEFYAQFLHEEHAQCHDSWHFNDDCPDCVAAGWAR